MTVVGQMQEVSLGEEGSVIIHARTILERQMGLVQSMGMDEAVDEAKLSLYLQKRIPEEALRLVIVPLIRAYVRDPDLLRRYNYGRGRGEGDVPVSEADNARVERARQWVIGLEKAGFSQGDLRELVNEMPFVGVYAALGGYLEMLIGMAF